MEGAATIAVTIWALGLVTPSGAVVESSRQFTSQADCLSAAAEMERSHGARASCAPAGSIDVTLPYAGPSPETAPRTDSRSQPKP
jgi:hypothetical protein